MPKTHRIELEIPRPKRSMSKICRRRGREGSYPPSPRTDPGVRNYRTGLFRQPRFRRQHCCLCYSPQGGLPCFTGPACPDKVSFVGYDCLSAPSPCERLSRLRVLWADPTPDRLRFSYLLFQSTYLLSQERIGSPKFLTFLSTHATLFVDPGRPSESSPIRFLCVDFWSVNTIVICIWTACAVDAITGLYQDFRKCGLPCGLRRSLCTLQ